MQESIQTTTYRIPQPDKGANHKCSKFTLKLEDDKIFQKIFRGQNQLLRALLKRKIYVKVIEIIKISREVCNNSLENVWYYFGFKYDYSAVLATLLANEQIRVKKIHVIRQVHKSDGRNSVIQIPCLQTLHPKSSAFP